MGSSWTALSINTFNSHLAAVLPILLLEGVLVATILGYLGHHVIEPHWYYSLKTQEKYLQESLLPPQQRKSPSYFDSLDSENLACEHPVSKKSIEYKSLMTPFLSNNV